MAEQTQHADRKHQNTRQVQPAKLVQQGPGRLAAEAESADLLALQRAVLDPARAAPGDILGLQRTAGNRAVSRLIQAKLTVGGARDRYEQEADRIADQVLGRPAPTGRQEPTGGQPEVQRQEDEQEVQTKPLAATITPLIQRQEEEEEVQTKPLLQRQEDEEEVQTKPLLQRRVNAHDSFEAGPEIENRLAAHKGNGHPLPDEVRTFMEPRFGADFSGVRVHADGQAADLTRSLNSQAFTHGQDIYLGANKHDPGTSAGKRLLAHELTHVVQQTGGGSAHRRLEAAQTKPSEVLQRALAFKPTDLHGQLTFKAKAAGFFGKKSTWAQIQETLQRYWADSARPVSLLLKLDDLADRWLAKHGLSADPNDQLKIGSLTTLKAKIGAELGSALPSTGTATQPTTATTATTAKHTPPAHPIPATPTATATTATTATTAKALPSPVAKKKPTPPPKISLLSQATRELGVVGIDPTWLAKFPEADLQSLLNAHRALTSRDVVGAENALKALVASADPFVKAVRGVAKTVLMRYHIGALNPEVQKVLDPNFKLSPSDSHDTRVLATAKAYLEDPQRMPQTYLDPDTGTPVTHVPLGAGAGGAGAGRANALDASKPWYTQFKVLDPVEVLGIEGYSSSLYKQINPQLRADITKLDPAKQSWAQSVTSGLNKLPPYPSPTVYRHDSCYPGFLETRTVGATVADFALLSTAKDIAGCNAGGENHEALSVITQHSGKEISPAAFFGGEGEVMFIPGTRFNVTDRADRAETADTWTPTWTPTAVKPQADTVFQEEVNVRGQGFKIKHIIWMKEVK